MKKLVIDPVTRVEGHGKVTIHLDDQNKVKDSFFLFPIKLTYIYSPS